MHACEYICASCMLAPSRMTMNNAHMHDEGEVGANDQIRNRDEVRPRQLQELDGLDEAQKLFANPAIEHQLGHHYPGQQVHDYSVLFVENQKDNGMARNNTFKQIKLTRNSRHFQVVCKLLLFLFVFCVQVMYIYFEV